MAMRSLEIWNILSSLPAVTARKGGLTSITSCRKNTSRGLARTSAGMVTDSTIAPGQVDRQTYGMGTTSACSSNCLAEGQSTDFITRSPASTEYRTHALTLWSWAHQPPPRPAYC